jgi:hypothetical protein
MNYTKNLGMKLRTQDFEFQSSVKNKEVDYEDFKKNDIEVTIDHEMKKVSLSLRPDNPFSDEIEVKGVRSMAELKMLHRLIYGVQKQSINNEEGD